MNERLFLERITAKNAEFEYRLPSNKSVKKFIVKLMRFLFPITQDCDRNPENIETIYQELSNDLLCLLEPLSKNLPTDAKTLAERFFANLPLVYEDLLLDAQAITDNDPASSSIEEVIAVYPGFYAIAVYRFAHILVGLDISHLPRQFTEHAHALTGIDIHPEATIGQSFFIDHGTGVVIGATCHIGQNVKIYQGVTLGALSVSKSLAETKRHPTIEDNVVIYANATILGGRTIIGENSTIGGNTWLTTSVGPNSQVYHQSEIKIRQVSL